MNIKQPKKNLSLMLGLNLCLVSSLILTSCKSNEIEFKDKILMVSQKPTYEIAISNKTFYVLSGTFKRMKPGMCTDLEGNLNIFSIGELLKQYPTLKTKQSLIEAAHQQLEFKKKNSKLFDPRLEL